MGVAAAFIPYSLAAHCALLLQVASGQLEADEELKDALKAWQAAAVPHGAPRGTGTGRARTGLGGRRRKGQWVSLGNERV